MPQPYEPVGVWLIDQWRQIGVTVKQNVLESAGWLQAQKTGDFEVSTNAPCNSIVEPDMDLHWYLTTSPVNFSKHKDTVMDELYQKQSRAIDPEERRKYLRAFEKRLYYDEVHFILTFQWNRIIPHLAKVRGYTITPSHFLNCQLDTVTRACAASTRRPAPAPARRSSASRSSRISAVAVSRSASMAALKSASAPATSSSGAAAARRRGRRAQLSRQPVRLGQLAGVVAPHIAGSGGREVEADRVGRVVGQQVADHDEVAERLAHLLALVLDHGGVQPEAGEGLRCR